MTHSKMSGQSFAVPDAEPARTGESPSSPHCERGKIVVRRQGIVAVCGGRIVERAEFGLVLPRAIHYLGVPDHVGRRAGSEGLLAPNPDNRMQDPAELRVHRAAQSPFRNNLKRTFAASRDLGRRGVSALREFPVEGPPERQTFAHTQETGLVFASTAFEHYESLVPGSPAPNAGLTVLKGHEALAAIARQLNVNHREERFPLLVKASAHV
jgi:hypothetical protein